MRTKSASASALPDQTLHQVDPGLDDKLRIIPIKHLTTGPASVTRGDILKGLSGDAAHEFFARTFVRGDNYRALMENLGGKDVQEKVLDLAKEPDKMVGELKKVMGGSFMVIAKHPIRARRLGDVISSETGSRLYKELVSSEQGSRAATQLFSDPVGAKIMARVRQRGGDELVGDMTSRQLANADLKIKPSNELLWPLARASNTSHIKGGQTDRELADMLQGADMKERSEILGEFFTSDKHTQRFKDRLRDDKFMAAVVGTLKQDAAWTQYTFLNVLKTPGGGKRLAGVIADEKGNQAIRELAKELEGQEAIFNMLHVKDEGGERPGLEAAKQIFKEKGGIVAAAKLMGTIHISRLMKMSGGLGDVSMEKAEKVAAQVR